MKKAPTHKRPLTWPEASRLLSQASGENWTPPKFPTRRLGHLYTLTSTTNKKTVELLVEDLAKLGHQVRLKIDQEETRLQKNLGTLFFIEIQETRLLLDQLGLRSPAARYHDT